MESNTTTSMLMQSERNNVELIQEIMFEKEPRKETSR